MYEKLFNLQKNPFSVTPDPNWLLMTPTHRESLSGLLYAIYRRKGFVVLTGEAGTGKTVLLRALMRSSKSTQFSVVLNPTLTREEFLEMVLLDFGVTDIPSSKAQRLFKLQDLLSQLQTDGIAPVLVVDEAQRLSVELLEEIRLLTNFETADRKLLQIVLAGQPELAAILNRFELRQLKQRIEVRLEIKPLSAAEVGMYIHHRWLRAGGSTPLPFSAEAVSRIAQASTGIPRLVNVICDAALLLAYAGRESSIKTAHIQQVLRDLDLSGAPRAGASIAPIETNGTPPRAAIRENGTQPARAQNGHRPAPSPARAQVAGNDTRFWRDSDDE
jgi:general secretion pathway protein A